MIESDELREIYAIAREWYTEYAIRKEFGLSDSEYKEESIESRLRMQAVMNMIGEHQEIISKSNNG